ncbi:uncharacterized protein MELLADRAFT_70206 [Melampsora larici-populina 98AG31]|uniref:Uncharacterized protein n=1 Tax=Melampsora larici-populina (strain 98AG31 / pathotype 3-4-7) TaxID=747676 RepID=F4SE13_MELLP|nr:uncharacterized protein MELLADRAFT_70206 [Melampsora larici-populina 98AG31]EGF97111.1 hypothetical protein MELLADRAFT_70206 [Melampsora larici-populina 98AG31]
MTEQQGSGWLGTLDFEDPATPRATPKTFTPITEALSTSPEAVGVLGSPWCPNPNWEQAWDEAAASLPPPLTSCGWSPASGEASLTSPSSSQTFREIGLAPLASSLASPETISSIYSPSPPNPFGVLEAGSTPSLEISIDTISTPIMKDLDNAKIVPQIRHQMTFYSHRSV